MVIHHPIPMLFYDCIKRTYKFTDWKDIRSTGTNVNSNEDENNLATNVVDDENFNSDYSSQHRIQRLRVVRKSRSLSNIYANDNSNNSSLNSGGSDATHQNENNNIFAASTIDSQKPVKNNNSNSFHTIRTTGNESTNTTSFFRRQNHNSNHTKTITRYCNDEDDISVTEEASIFGSDDEGDELLFSQLETFVSSRRQNNNKSSCTTRTSIEIDNYDDASASQQLQLHTVKEISSTERFIESQSTNSTPISKGIQKIKTTVANSISPKDTIVDPSMGESTEKEILVHEVKNLTDSISVNNVVFDKEQINEHKNNDCRRRDSISSSSSLSSILNFTKDDDESHHHDYGQIAQMSIVPFISLDIHVMRGEMNNPTCKQRNDTSRNYNESDDFSGDSHTDEHRDDSVRNCNLICTRSISDLKQLQCQEEEQQTQYYHRQPKQGIFYNFSCEQSEPPAGAVAISNSKLRIPIPSHITFAEETEMTTTKLLYTSRLHQQNQKFRSHDTSMHNNDNVCDVPMCSTFYSSRMSFVGDSNNTRIKNNNNIVDEFDIDSIYDPTEPLIHGSLSSATHGSLSKLSDKVFQLLLKIHDSINMSTSTALAIPFVNDFCNALVHSIIEIIVTYPIVCQIRYQVPGYRGPCFLMSYFCSIGLLNGINTVYNVYPESIGYSDLYVGTPLHYALFYKGNDIEVIQTIERLFPESVRIANHHQEKQTPLHYACTLLQTNNYSKQHNVSMENFNLRDNLRSSSRDEYILPKPTKQVINFLFQCYPNAVQIHDDLLGMTPVHAICNYSSLKHNKSAGNCSITQQVYNQNGHLVHKDEKGDIPNEILLLDVLQSFLQASPMAVSAVTLVDTQKPLHIAAGSGAPTSILRLLHQYDTTQIKFTNDQFQTPLHVAILLLQRYPYTATTTTATNVVGGNCTNNNNNSIVSVAHDKKEINCNVLVDNIAFLVEACPMCLLLLDENDETPLQIATRLGCSKDIIILLKSFL